jgi:hypothetical protein
MGACESLSGRALVWAAMCVGLMPGISGAPHARLTCVCAC